MGMDIAAASPTGSTPRSTRYQALDVWRGIVCVVVVLEHSGVALWPGSLGGDAPWLPATIVKLLMLNVGAPLFFVISGYCIASSLESTLRKGTSPGRFLAKRLWRIFPPYWASVAIIGLLVLTLDRVGLGWLHVGNVGLELFNPLHFERVQWLGNITLTETWRPHLTGTETLLLNRVAWALCYQEQFYLICMACLLIAPRRLFAALAVASGLIVAMRIMLWDSGYLFRLSGLAPDLWHEFAVGLALYWRINKARTTRAKLAIDVLLVATLGVGLATQFVTTAAAAAFGLVLIVAYRWDDAIARVRRLDPVRALGRRSYAVYLIHLPVCTIGNVALVTAGVSGFWPRALLVVPTTTAASIVAGWAFHHLIDRHFTNLPDLSGLRRRATTIAARPRPTLDVEGPSGSFQAVSA